MKRTKGYRVLISSLSMLIFIVSILISSQAFADWRDDAYRLFQKDEYDSAIKIAEQHRDDRFAKMILCFSYLQRWVFTKSKLEKKKSAVEFKNLSITTTVKDIDDIGMFTKEVGKPQVVKKANLLLKKAFSRLITNEDVYPIIKYLNWESLDSRKLAAKAVARIVTNRRKVVRKGGTLRKTDIELFSDKKLIEGLVSQADTLKDARKALVYIEEPAVPSLEKAGTAGSVKALGKTNTAIAKRKKKYPNSNWYSAMGEKRI